MMSPGGRVAFGFGAILVGWFLLLGGITLGLWLQFGSVGVVAGLAVMWLGGFAISRWAKHHKGGEHAEGKDQGPASSS